MDGIINPFIALPYLKDHLPVLSCLDNVWHLFVIRNHERDRLRQHLYDYGIQTLIHYPIPPHKQKAYSEFSDINLPLTEQIHNEVLSLPISQVMNPDEADKVIEAVNRFR
jgi:dTDP-4-amino-4,6-dideoxygalactose transaminase